MPSGFWRRRDTVKTAPADPYLGGSQGFGAPLHYSWGARPVPSTGAGSYAFETLALPRYSPLGTGVGTNPGPGWFHTTPAAFALQGVNLTAIGAPGVPTGGAYTAPLDDTQPTNLPPETLMALQTPQSFILPRN